MCVYGRSLRAWFKGADTSAACRFLEFRYAQLEPQAYTQAIYEAICSANQFLRGLYGHGLWIRASDAQMIQASGLKFVSQYVTAAHHALVLEKTRFKLAPKLHALLHIIQYLRDELATGAQWVQSPIQWSTQQDEDFVGKISKLSLAVSSRTVHAQTMAKYATNFWEHWKDWKSST